MGHVIEVNDQTFEVEVLKADRPVLVDFGATWCQPCKALAPIVEALAAERAGEVKVVAVDVDESPEVARRYGVRGLPTVAVFACGERTAQHVGLASKARLEGLLEGAK